MKEFNEVQDQLQAQVKQLRKELDIQERIICKNDKSTKDQISHVLMANKKINDQIFTNKNCID